MAKGDNTPIKLEDQVYFKRVAESIVRKCEGSVTDALVIIDISKQTYSEFINNNVLTKKSAQKILDAHKSIANYEKRKVS